jgi:hypothetical protein
MVCGWRVAQRSRCAKMISPMIRTISIIAAALGSNGRRNTLKEKLR